MPQAPPEIAAQWEDDWEAWRFLEGTGFTHKKGVIQPKPGHELTEREGSAIDYLCVEWDWAYELIA